MTNEHLELTLQQAIMDWEEKTDPDNPVLSDPEREALIQRLKKRIMENYILKRYGVPLYKKLGKVLRNARCEKGLTQTDVARHIGVGQSYVASLERGVYYPGKYLEALWAFLDIQEPPPSRKAKEAVSEG